MAPKKADKKAKKTAKAEAMKAQTDKYKADRAAIDKALSADDVFDTLKPFKRVVKAANGLDATFVYQKAEALSADTKAWCFQTLKTNMKTFYENCAGFGWKEKDKRRELDDRDGRYLIAYDTKSLTASTATTPATTPAADGKAADGKAAADPKAADAKAATPAVTAPVPLGFAHIRFLLEDEERILYVWELQMSDAVKRKGLGKWFMSVIELMAWRVFDMERIALTVFKANTAANKFFRDTCKFEDDDADPSTADPDNAERFGYSILCKKKKQPAAAAAAGAAAAGSSGVAAGALTSSAPAGSAAALGAAIAALAAKQPAVAVAATASAGDDKASAKK